MSDYFELVSSRESCRNYNPDRRPTREQLVKCIQTAQVAPSACNSQPWSYIVVNDPEKSPLVAAATQTADKQEQQGGMMSGNELKTRFLASEKFKAVYDQAYWDLYEQIYGSGFAEKTLENLRSQVPATDGTPQSDIDSAADKLQEFITQRKDYLATQKA